MATCSHCLLFLLSFWGMWTCHAAKDTLRLGDTLDSSSSLVSATGKSNFSYLTVRWDDSRNHAWIANPVTPVLYSVGILVLDKNRTLKIMQKGKDHIELFTAPKATSDNVVATLLDSGNFILQELSSDGSTKQVLWQSFDHPSDTLLPGVKFGVNRKYDHIVSLSSWSSMYNASPGVFTLDWDPNVHELKINRHGILYWTSGILRNRRFKFMLPEKLEQRKYNLCFRK